MKISTGASVAALLALSLAAQAPANAADQSVQFAGATFTNKGLVAMGRLPSNLRDEYGETFGSGSGLTVEPGSWKRAGDGYDGVFFVLPDRGYNAVGTTNYRSRVNRLQIHMSPKAGVVAATLTNSIMLTDSEGQVLSGLDPDEKGVRKAAGGFPDLPEAKFGRVALDPEGIVRLRDGTFLISDEYGPYIYRFSAEGKMLNAIRPPEAFIPQRNGQEHFGSNNPGPNAKAPTPPNPETGRQNNQGFEGLTLTPSGKLVALLQSANRQDGGDNAATRNNTRALVYDISDWSRPRLTAEYVVPLPVFKDGSGATLVAAQSEILALSDTMFLMIARDSGNGYGLKGVTSLYRRVELVNLAGATNIARSDFDWLKPIAPKGVLDRAIRPATTRSLVDINDNGELNKLGLHNGAPNDRTNLSEKWEGLSLVPALDPQHPNDYFLFIVNDNDFLTTDGFQVGAPYKDEGGSDVDTTFLVYRVTLPKLARETAAR